jgi:hypothetical protein
MTRRMRIVHDYAFCGSIRTLPVLLLLLLLLMPCVFGCHGGRQ